MRELLHRVGRRGAYLLFLAMVDLAYAQGLLFPTAAARSSRTYQFLVGVIPLWAWGALWGGVGLLCLVCAFLRRDVAAFTAGAVLKLGFGVMMLLAWWFADLNRGYISAAIWLGFAGITLMIAGWQENFHDKRDQR